MDKRSHDIEFATEGKNMEINLKEESFVNFMSVPSLSDISAVSIITTLSKRSDIAEMMLHMIQFNSSKEGTYKELRASMCEKISLLPLPKALKYKITHKISPIACQMYSWLSELEKHTSPFIYNRCINHICWTMYGTIDTSKTIEIIVKQDCSIKNICDIYFVSRRSCIPGFWCDNWKDMLSLDMKRIVYGDVYPKEGKKLKYWEIYTDEEKMKMNDKIQKDFDYLNMHNKTPSVICERMIRERNWEGFYYFWNKIAEGEANQYVERFVAMIGTSISIPGECWPMPFRRTDGRSGILCFLLSQIKDKEQQKNIILKHVRNILLLLIYSCRFSKFFVPTIKLIWDSLDEDFYNLLLSVVLNGVDKCDHTAELFKDIWVESPAAFRKSFIQHISEIRYEYTPNKRVLLNLLDMEHVDFFEIILRSCDEEDRDKIIGVITQPSNLSWKIETDENILNKLDIFLDRIISPKCDIMKIKKNIVAAMVNTLCRPLCVLESAIRKFEKFVHWISESEEHKDYLKKRIIRDLMKRATTSNFVRANKYEFVNTLMSWYSSSETEIKSFKKDFAHRCLKNDWMLFLTYMDWFFDNEEDLKQFKAYIIEYYGRSELCNLRVSRELWYAGELKNWLFKSN